ncbi:MAG: FAD-binding oxidoreductase [Motiliproteus sp.]
MTDKRPYSDTGFWFDTLEETIVPRAALTGSVRADVVIVGAGYTGLWTAYYLKQHSPQLSVVVLEAETAGFGASGRNGGWLMGSCGGGDKYLASLPAQQQERCRALLSGIVDHVAALLQRESIECDLHHGGVLYAAARYPEQLSLQQDYLKHLHQIGFTEQDYRWLNAAELQQQVRMRNGYGAIYSPHCATINPAKLVRGLARLLERQGVTIYEQSAVTKIDSGRVFTANGQVDADIIVPAMEGYGASAGRIAAGCQTNRYVLPVQSLIVATEPLSTSQWDQIGLQDRPAFSDGGHQVTYGQRTADGRMIFGARGSYRFGGKPQSQFDPDSAEFSYRQKLLCELFPALEGVGFSHGWGGTLGITRRFSPHALYDKASGIAMAGGYGGEGVGASNLFGRTLADLILERDSELVAMSWVYRQPAKSALKRWEPEPFRWLTYRAINACFGWEERILCSPQSAPWQKRLASKVASTMARVVE